MQVPGDAKVPSTAWTRLPSASLPLANGHRVVQTCNLTYCPTATFATICGRFALRAGIVDRLTYKGQIIETGTSSYRLAHARANRNAP
jgi:hypothetical protein